jgi:hypothetical protein
MGTKPSRFIPATETAAFLVLKGFDCRGCRPAGPGSCGFLFDESQELQQALLQFTSGRSTVEPRMFLRTLNDLRDLARSELAR